ncbi:hypothetical protein JCM3770_003935 [Rhodotorula araucariae]
MPRRKAQTVSSPSPPLSGSLSCSPNAASAGAVAGPGPSTSAHRAGGGARPAATEDAPPVVPKKRGRPRKEPAAAVEQDEGPPAQRARNTTGGMVHFATAEKAFAHEAEEDEGNDEDEDEVEYPEDFAAPDEDDGEEDNDDPDDEVDSVGVMEGGTGGREGLGKGKKRAQDNDDSGSDTSSATSRSSTRGGSSRPRKSIKRSVIDKGGVRLNSSMRYTLPPPVPRLFRIDNLEELFAAIGDPDNSEGLNVLPDDLREALEDAMDPQAAEGLLETIDEQLSLYDRAWALLNAELTKAQVEESVLSNVKLIASNKRDEIRRAQKASRSFSPS